MKRALAASAVVTFTLFGLAPAVGAQNQPTRGDNSTDRNDAGFGSKAPSGPGPHCHVLIVENAGNDLTVRVFPSHQGHFASGLSGSVFAADPDCDGDAGF